MDYKNLTLTELRTVAKERGIKSPTIYKKDELVQLLLESESKN